MARTRTPPEKGLQADLFAHAELYPVRRAVEGPRSPDLSLRIKTALGQALKECPKSATVIAAEMTDILPPEQSITSDALYACTAPAKPTHHLTLPRFLAFVRVTGATWLWDVLVEDDGLVVMEGREAKLANIGLLEQEARRINAALAALKAEIDAEPVVVANRRRRRP